MSAHDSITGSAVVLSPQQFHGQVKGALRIAMAARSSKRGAADDEGTRALAGLLQEVPSLAPRAPDPPFAAPALVGGVREMIDRRQVEAAAGSEQLLEDLLEFVLAFYPEAEPPPSFSDQL